MSKILIKFFKIFKDVSYDCKNYYIYSNQASFFSEKEQMIPKEDHK